MKHFKEQVESLAKEFSDEELKLSYDKRNDFNADACVSISTKGHYEMIDIMFMPDEYDLSSTSLNFANTQCTTIKEAIEIIKHRVIYALKIVGANAIEVDFELLKQLEAKYDIKIKTLYGSTSVVHAGFSIICNMEKEFAYLTIGIKTIEVPLSKIKETLEQLSQFNGIN